MIKNERQHEVTKTKLRELETALEEYRASDADKDNHLLRKLHEDSYQALIDDLQADLQEYEELRQCKLQHFECASLIELPQTLIKARIARGISQKELGLLCGMSERRIRHYEETDYEGAEMWRVTEIATLLCVEVRAVVSLKKFEPIPSLEELSQLKPPTGEKGNTQPIS